MCGRYRLWRRKQIIEEYFDASDWQDDWSPRFNVAPMQLRGLTFEFLRA
jgi:putative SOS response-associated peptidase YedK